MAEIIDDGTYGSDLQRVDASVWPTATTWGLISAGITFVFLLIQYTTGMMEIDPTSGQPSGGWITTILSLAIGIAIIYLGLKSYRDKANGGVLTLGRGVFWSFAEGLVGGLATAILTYIFYAFIAPDVLEDMATVQMAVLEEQGMSGDQLESVAAMSSSFITPTVFAGSALITSMIFSVILGLLVSLGLKTR